MTSERAHGSSVGRTFLLSGGAHHQIPTMAPRDEFRAVAGRSSSALRVTVPNLPESPFFMRLIAYQDNKWEQEAEANGSRALCSAQLTCHAAPCSGHEMKGWKGTRGKVWTFSCWVVTHFNQKYCQKLYFFSFQCFPVAITLFLRKIFILLA